jgi:arsenite methyltransferase
LLGQALTLSSGTLMLLYVTYGKFRQRDRMLSMIDWKGSETVLDVGTGLGLLLIGAAKRLTTGKSVGIDIWSQKDLSGNYAEKTWQNAELEGVRDRVEILSQDATAMSFEDESFDVILTNLCLHNIPSRDGRDQACREISRVLKRGGTALVSDFQKTSDYAQIFRQQGLNVEKLGPFTTLKLTVLKVIKN